MYLEEHSSLCVFSPDIHRQTNMKIQFLQEIEIRRETERKKKILTLFLKEQSKQEEEEVILWINEKKF